MRKIEPIEANAQARAALGVEAEFAEIRLVLDGDRERFRYFVERYKGPIFRLALRRLEERGESEDIAQEVFVKAYRALGTFRFEASFFTWITRIALNLIHSRCLERARERRFASAAHPDHHPSGEEIAQACPHELRVQAEDLARYRAAFAALDRRFSEPLMLIALEGRSYEEVAACLEIPIGTVRSRINKARRLLKEALGRP